MTVFLDASALLAMIREEPESGDLQATMDRDPDRRTSGLAMWEAARALGRAANDSIDAGWFEVTRFCAALRIAVVASGEMEAIEAVRAHTRYGKGNHAAKLNMGDCFAYACAKTNDARLLYKGADFAKTDLA